MNEPLDGVIHRVDRYLAEREFHGEGQVIHGYDDGSGLQFGLLRADDVQQLLDEVRLSRTGVVPPADGRSTHPISTLTGEPCTGHAVDERCIECGTDEEIVASLRFLGGNAGGDSRG